MADSGQSCAATLRPAATSAVRDRTSCSAANTATRALRSTVNGLAGKSRTANTMAKPPPISASSMRSANGIAVQGQHQDRRNDRLIDEHHALADKAPPITTATHNASGTVSAMEITPSRTVCQGAHPDSQGDADDHLHGALRA